MTALELSADDATILAQALCAASIATVGSAGEAWPPRTMTPTSAHTIVKATADNFADTYPWLARLEAMAATLATFVEPT